MGNEKYVPHPGDRIRVVIEGTVDFTVGTGEYRIRGARCGGYTTVIHPDAAGVVSIEKARDPLPTTPGSVIQYADDKYGEEIRQLRTDGCWQSPDGMIIDALMVEQTAHAVGFIVHFDAGKLDTA